MKRLIYVKLNEFQYISKYPVPIASGKAHPMFDTNTKTFKILDVATNVVIMEGSATSPHKLKLKIKQALTVLGANFNTEKRYRDYKINEES